MNCVETTGVCGKHCHHVFILENQDVYMYIDIGVHSKYSIVAQGCSIIKGVLK